MTNHAPIALPEAILRSWQEIVDILAEMLDIPAGLIMRVEDPDIGVLVASRGADNPYTPGDSEQLWGSGLYCETVVRSRQPLRVPDALADEAWRDNPDIRLGMVSYLGFPLRLPDGTVFGTICVLDRRRNDYSEKFERLMQKFQRLVEADLEVLHMNRVLGDRDRGLSDYLKELRALRGIVPICAGCKSIREGDDHWRPIEEFLLDHPGADFSHVICPTCMAKLYPPSSRHR